MSWWDDFADTAGKTIRTGWRGAVHIGGGVKNGGIKGAVFGLLLAAAAGIAITVAAAFVLPWLMTGLGAALGGFGVIAGGAAGGAAGFAATYSVSTMGALGAGALASIPALMMIKGPHPVVRGLGAVLAVPALAGIMSISGAVGGLTALIGIGGAVASTMTAPFTTKWGAMIGGALGGIGRIFNWPAKEVERETGIEQHKVLDARQENQQVAEHEAQQAARLEDVQRRAQEQKAARFQMHNPIAQENGGSKILEKQKERQTEIGTGVPVAAMG